MKGYSASQNNFLTHRVKYYLTPYNYWKTLPGLCCPFSHRLFIMIHITFGIIILLLGEFQFIPQLRQHSIGIHRWVGRIYMSSCIITSVAGLIFLCLNGTVGGSNMTVAFTVYGIFLFLTSNIAWILAYKGKYHLHKWWAIRTFTLGIASWV